MSNTLAQTIAAHANIKLFTDFKDTSGTAMVLDVGGANGSYSGTPTLNQTGRRAGDKAVHFDGVDDFGLVSDRAALDVGDVFTIAVGFKRLTDTEGETAIVWKGQNGYALHFNGDDTIIAVKPGAAVLFASTVAVTADGNWHTVTWQKNGATSRLTIDGVVRTGTVTDVTIEDTAIDLYFAGNTDSQYANVALGWAALWNASVSNAYLTDLDNLDRDGPLTAGTLSTGTVTSTSVALSWVAATGGTAAYSYQVQRAPDVSGAAGTYANIGSSQAGTTYSDTGLTPSTKYWWRVIATDSATTAQTDTSGAVTTTTSGAGGSAATIGRTLAETIAAHANVVFHARFDDLTGTSATLAIGSPAGTYVGATLGVPGGLANHTGNVAARLPGAASRIWFAHRAALAITTLTIWLRVRPTRLSHTDWQALWSKGDFGFGAYINPSNVIVLAVPSYGLFCNSNAPLPTPNVYYSIGWQYAPGSVNRLTINAADVTASPVYVPEFAANTTDLAFGSNPQNDGEYLQADYDEAAIFNTAVANLFLFDLDNLAVYGPLTPPAVTVTGTTSSTVGLSWPAATGGTATYAYQVQRAPDSAGMPGTWANIGASQSGLTYSDTGRTASTVYHYRVQVTDSAVTAQTASSASVPALTGSAADTTPPVVTINAPSTITSTGAWINLSINETASVWVEWGTASGNYAAGPGAYTPLLASGAVVYVLTGLPSNTVIHYRVRGRDAAGNVSSFSADQTFSTLADTPLPSDPALVTVGPTVLARTLVDATATVEWTNDVLTTGVVIWGSVNPATTGGAYANATAPDALSTSHSVTFELVEGVANYWAAVSITEADRETVTPGAATIFRTAVPPVVTNVQVVPASTTAVVTWDTDEATAQDKVDYGLTTGYGNQAVVTGVFPAGPGHTITLSPLQPSTTYQGRVRSTDAAGAETTPGVTFVFTTQAAAAPVPPAPSNLTAPSILFSQVVVSWIDNAGTETGQTLERATGAGAFAQIQSLGPDVTTATDSTVTGGVTYSYRVRAFNASGNSPYSNVLAVPVPPAPAIPAAPSGLTATPTSASLVTVAWTDNATNEAAYEVERGPSSTGPWTLVATLAANATGYLDTSVVSVTTYWYRVRATNADGASAYSNTDDATTPSGSADTTPPVLSAIVATPTSTTLVVTWTTDEVSDSQVEYGTSVPYTNATVLNSGLVTSHTVTIPSLSPSTLYHFRVLSRDGAGNLSTSSDQTATTSVPTDVTPPTLNGILASGVTSQSAVISWTTTEMASSKVDYGTSTSYGSSTSLDSTPRTSHSRTLTGLTANTLYHYRVRSADGAGNEAVSGDRTFTTLVAGGGGPGTLPDPPASGTVNASIQVLIAFTTFPTEAPVWEDVTDAVRAASWRYGRDNELSQVSAGTATVVLDNRDRRFDPTNAAGPYYGTLRPMRRLKIRANWAGAYSDCFTGYIERWPLAWEGPMDGTVTLPVTDGFGVLARCAISRPFPAQRADERINAVLDEARWTTGTGWLLGVAGQSELGVTTFLGGEGDRLISQGDAQLQATTLQDVDALSHALAVTETEQGLAYVTPSGEFRWRARHELQLMELVSQATFGEDAAGGEVLYVDLEVDDSGGALYTQARVQRENGATATSEDAAAVQEFYPRTGRATSLHDTDLEAQHLSDTLVAEHKEPDTRIVGMPLDPAYQPTKLWPLLLTLQLGDVVTARRRPPGGGAVLEQRSRIEAVDASYLPGDANPNTAQWAWRWRLSPVGTLGGPWLLGVVGKSELGVTTILRW